MTFKFEIFSHGRQKTANKLKNRKMNYEFLHLNIEIYIDLMFARICHFFCNCVMCMLDLDRNVTAWAWQCSVGPCAKPRRAVPCIKKWIEWKVNCPWRDGTELNWTERMLHTQKATKYKQKTDWRMDGRLVGRSTNEKQICTKMFYVCCVCAPRNRSGYKFDVNLRISHGRSQWKCNRWCEQHKNNRIKWRTRARARKSTKSKWISKPTANSSLECKIWIFNLGEPYNNSLLCVQFRRYAM